jgi:hypothetical protein
MALHGDGAIAGGSSLRFFAGWRRLTGYGSIAYLCWHDLLR